MSSACYIAIDLKSFYASVECVSRGLDPLDTNLVVADASRTQKTICLAISPSIKAYGLKGRARLFEVIQHIREANRQRSNNAPGQRYTGKSHSARTLATHPELAIDYIVAPPRMAHYISESSRIYQVYLKYVAPEDIHVYSIDEVFIDATDYLRVYGVSAHELALRIVRDVLSTTGITATAGIGSNLYLCKIAMDIVAKKMAPDKDGVRIAELDEMAYRQLLWDHKPLTDFWRVGHGTARRLAQYGITTMGDIAICSIENEDLLYDMFGINAELLIDHAWGWESVTMPMVKAYRPDNHSIGSGQVLSCPYTFDKARVVAWEMAESLSLQLLEKSLMTDHLTLTIGYDSSSLSDPDITATYFGKITTDFYGRAVPAHAHGTTSLNQPTSSSRIISKAVTQLFDGLVNQRLLIRRITLTAINVKTESEVRTSSTQPKQLDLFTDYAALRINKENEERTLKKERSLQQTLLRIKEAFGKNSILKGLNYADGATQRLRNQQIGGHHE